MHRSPRSRAAFSIGRRTITRAVTSSTRASQRVVGTLSSPVSSNGFAKQFSEADDAPRGLRVCACGSCVLLQCGFAGSGGRQLCGPSAARVDATLVLRLADSRARATAVSASMCGGPMSSASSSPGGVLRALSPGSTLGASLDADDHPYDSPPSVNFEEDRPGGSGTGAIFKTSLRRTPETQFSGDRDV